MNKFFTYTSLTLVTMMTFWISGCNQRDFDTRANYGRGGLHNIYGNMGGAFGGSTYDANIGVYLVYNSSTRSSGVADPISGPNTGGVGGPGSTVTPFGGGDTPQSPNEIPSQTGVVTPFGNNAAGGGVAPCVIRRFDVPQNGRGLINQTQFATSGAARTIASFQCSTQSRMATSTKGVYITNTGPAGNLVTYVPLSINGGTLGSFSLSFDGPIGTIDAGDSDIIVAAYAQGSGKEDTLVVMREGFTDNLGRVMPGIEYEVRVPRHIIKDVVLDQHQNTAFIATEVPGGWGKIIAYNMEDSQAFNSQHFSNVLGRSLSVMPPNTMQRNPNQMSSFGFDLGQGSSVFLTSSAAETIKNFDGLTAARIKDGRIFVMQDLYGENLDPTTKEQMEMSSGRNIDQYEYIGTRSGYLWASANVQNTANPFTMPGSRPQYTDVAVGDNFFYALGGNSIYYFLGDSHMLLQSGVPRQRSLMMGDLNTIEIDNQSNVALITSHRGVKVCHVNGGSLNCGPQSTADLNENQGSMVLDGRMFPKTYTLNSQENIDMRADQNNANDEENNG